MGIDYDFRKGLREVAALGRIAAAHLRQGLPLGEEPRQGARVLQIAKRLAEMGFSLVATVGHRQAPAAAGHDGGGRAQGQRELPAQHRRPHEARRDRASCSIPPRTDGARRDSYLIRRSAVTQNISYYTTVDGAQAAIGGIEALLKGEISVKPLQEYYHPLPPGERGRLRPPMHPPHPRQGPPDRRARRRDPGRRRADGRPHRGARHSLQDRLAALHRRRARARSRPSRSGAPRSSSISSFHDIPQHGGGAPAREATRMGVLMFNVHALRRGAP